MSQIEDQRDKLESWLKTVASADAVEIIAMKTLTGGAIQENWKISCLIEGGTEAGEQHYVLRCDALSGISDSLSRSQEFKILKTVFAAGVTVPEPLWLSDDLNLLGRKFYIMRLVDGIALGPKIVKTLSLGGDREALGKQLGLELAKIHSIQPPVEELDFLPIFVKQPSVQMIHQLYQQLDAIGQSHPILEWGLRWAEYNLPQKPVITLVHQDYRTGNYLIDKYGLKGILDWEFTGWGDPMSDLGWFCAECWRFSRPDLEAGGIASRQSFYAGYNTGNGQEIDDQAVHFWELIAHIRWAIIALQQAERHLSGTQLSLELALTGRILPDIENQILNMTSPSTWRMG